MFLLFFVVEGRGHTDGHRAFDCRDVEQFEPRQAKVAHARGAAQEERGFQGDFAGDGAGPTERHPLRLARILADMHGRRVVARQRQQSQPGVDGQLDMLKTAFDNAEMKLGVDHKRTGLELEPDQLIDIHRRVGLARRCALMPADRQSIGGPQIGHKTWRGFFQAHRAVCRRRLDRRGVFGQRQLEPRSGHTRDGDVETGQRIERNGFHGAQGTDQASGNALDSIPIEPAGFFLAAAILHRRPQRDLQAILARLGYLEHQRSGGRVPRRFNRTAVEQDMLWRQVCPFGMKGESHPREAPEHLQVVQRPQRIDTQAAGTGLGR